MGNLYSTIMKLCESRNIKGAKLCSDVGISKGLLTDLKMGRRTGVSAVTAQKIASYFNVSVGYLLGEEEQKENPTTQMSSEVDEITIELMDIIQNGTDEDRRDMLDMLRLLKKQRSNG